MRSSRYYRVMCVLGLLMAITAPFLFGPPFGAAGAIILAFIAGNYSAWADDARVEERAFWRVFKRVLAGRWES